MTTSDIIKEFEFRKVEITKWFDEFKDKSGPPGFGGGSDVKFGEGGDREKGIDKKEIAVWKLPEEVDKTAFRHWIEAVDMQLELVHGLKFASFVLNHVRRAKVAIHAEVLMSCIVAAKLDMLKAKLEMKIPDEDDLDQPQDYPIHQRTDFLYADLVGKLNTNLFH